jgi:hypothetical protein
VKSLTVLDDIFVSQHIRISLVDRTMDRLETLKIERPEEFKLILDVETAQGIARNFPNLKSLTIDAEVQPSQLSFEVLLKGLVHLENLEFTSFSAITLEVFNAIRNHGSNLKTVHLGGNINTRQVFAQFLKECKGLNFTCDDMDVSIEED